MLRIGVLTQMLTAISNIKWLLIKACPSMSNGYRQPLALHHGQGYGRLSALDPGASLNRNALKLECVCLRTFPLELEGQSRLLSFAWELSSHPCNLLSPIRTQGIKEMDHSHMNHGNMDDAAMPGMCSMNVRRPSNYPRVQSGI
jgi:hypothetical protein